MDAEMYGKETLEATTALYLKGKYEEDDAGVARKLARNLRELGRSLDEADERRGLLLAMAEEVDKFKVALLRGRGEVETTRFREVSLRYSELELERFEAMSERLKRQFLDES